ncbi:DUF928 domain-containing protein [Nostoc sp. TCL26-01]|uniref:DUF928 domain-containing protein n=1 Tax=Nostoc sp. TCL26-01 TaxID=2576904 RepID=UPI0015B811B9|nr:DUF928 domain-containing protein [Nostoc sp. TCL26-01]QLE55093.1 DUF928 domain-containing protein [Nostoc sp. TCL26-01]
MSQNFFTLRQYLTSKLLFSCTLILYLILTTTAIAKYTPPKNPSNPTTPTGSNGSRGNGCQGDAKTSLTALAPLTYIGQTVSLQPTFVWFVPDSQSRKIEFTIYKYVNGKFEKIDTILMQSSPGIMTYSLANTKTSLSVGEKYLWQVALLCNLNHPSKNLIARAEIEVVTIAPSLKNALARTKEFLQRSDLYAEKGLWYDAMAEILNNSVNKASIFQLLVELKNLELDEISKISEPARKKSLQQQVLRLQEIIATEQLNLK